MNFLSEWSSFLRESRRTFQTTGAVLPSGRFLGRALTSELRKPRDSYRILEAGPGTGAVTEHILQALQPGDQLDIVELNERFVEIVKKRFETEPIFQSKQSQARVLHQGVEQVEGQHYYDAIISGLPLNNFPVALVGKLFEVFRRLLKPSGTLSYFEYAFVREIKMPFVGASELERLRGVSRIVTEQIQQYQIRRQFICMNVPPAFARHLRFSSHHH